MSETEIPLARKLPKLSEFLTAERADDFHEWAAISFFAEHVTEDDTSKAALRILRVLLVATVEGMNIEHEHGRDDRDTVLMFARLMGYAAGMAVGSVVEDPAHLRRIVRVMTEEFKHGGKMAADSIMEAAQ
jgi:hypothetical protein